jgi:hypothetical protein
LTRRSSNKDGKNYLCLSFLYFSVHTWASMSFTTLSVAGIFWLWH